MKGHIRPRGPRRWQLVYDLPPGPDGKRRQRYETVEGPKRDAQVRLREILQALDSGVYAEPRQITVGQLLDDFLESIKPTITENTWQRYEVIVRRHLRPILGHVRAQKLTGLQIEAAMRELRAPAGGGKGLSEASLKNVHNVLNSAMERALKHRLVAVNPCQTVTPPRPQRKEAQALTEAQTAELLAAAQGTRLHAPVLVAVTTGLRTGELLGLKWEDIDMDPGTLTVRRAAQLLKDQGPVLVDRVKTSSSRRAVTLPSLAVETLRAHRKEQLAEKMRLRLVWREPAGELVFPDELGGIWNPGALSCAFKRLAVSLGFDGIHFHSLRHTHATHLLRAGIPAKVASGRLGHSSTRVTLDTYSHLFADAQDEAAQRIDEKLREALG